MTLPRLIFVTGKGGSGKSTVAAALALALSRRRPTMLADLDSRLSAVRLLGARTNGGGGQPAHVDDNLEALAVSARAELEAFIERIVPFKMLSHRMLRSRTFGYVTAALPGLEAFLMLEKLRFMAENCAVGDRYLVVDAPASGGALEFLSVAAGIKGIAPMGTLNRFALEVESFLRDEARFGVMLAVRPEEMALREAIETASFVKDRLGIRCVGAILNGASRTLFDAAELSAIGPFKAHASLALRRNAIAECTVRARAELRAAGLHVVELPILFSPELGRSELKQLGDRLEAELLEK